MWVDDSEKHASKVAFEQLRLRKVETNEHIRESLRTNRVAL